MPSRGQVMGCPLQSERRRVGTHGPSAPGVTASAGTATSCQPSLSQPLCATLPEEPWLLSHSFLAKYQAKKTRHFLGHSSVLIRFQLQGDLFTKDL